jgi:hypothetical protein
MGTIEGDIEIETPGLPFPYPIEGSIVICGKRYVIYKKEEIFDSAVRPYHIKHICYLKEVP